MNIYFWGNSLTRGQLGYTYVPACRAGDRCINFGKNGDTTYGIFKRLLSYASAPESAPGIYVVACGTNDLLLQFKQTASFFWRLRAQGAAPRKRPVKNVREFERLYRAGVRKLKEQVSDIVLVGIPYFEIEHFPREEIRKYNVVIAQIASDNGLPFVDCCGIQEKLMGTGERHDCKHGFFSVALTTAAMKLFPTAKAVLSSRRNLSLTVDGVHLNAASAAAIGKELETRLVQYRS